MIKHFFAAITGNIISLIGTLMMVLSLLFIVALLVMQAMGFEGGAYIGIVTFVLLPATFLLGVAVVPLGIWLQHRRDARAAAEGRPVGHLPIIDLKRRAAYCSDSPRSRCRSSPLRPVSPTRPCTSWIPTNSAAPPATR
jgi:hypothetical protein